MRSISTRSTIGTVRPRIALASGPSAGAFGAKKVHGSGLKLRLRTTSRRVPGWKRATWYGPLPMGLRENSAPSA